MVLGAGTAVSLPHLPCSVSDQELATMAFENAWLTEVLLGPGAVQGGADEGVPDQVAVADQDNDQDDKENQPKAQGSGDRAVQE